MLSLLSVFLVSHALFLPACALAGPTTRPAAMPDHDITTLVRQLRKEHKVPALAAAVVHGDKTIALAAAGHRKARSKHAVTLGDRWHLGSCTKSMTATLCAMLVEDGKLRWNMTVAEALPESIEKLHADFRAVTLEQLLCHHSGLPNDHRPDIRIWPRVLLLKGELPAQRRTFVEMYLGRAPAHPPGKKYAYSNAAFVAAGAMAEAVTGMSYESVMRTRLFEPLGMTSAGFGPPGSDNKVDQPWGHDSMMFYLPVEPGPTADNPPVIAPAGTVHCSIGDWAKYAALHLSAAAGKPHLLKAETLARLHSVPFGHDYGFGWLHARPNWAGEDVMLHDGSNGRWYALVVIAPKANLAVMVTVNAADEAAQNACGEAARNLYKMFAANPDPLP